MRQRAVHLPLSLDGQAFATGQDWYAAASVYNTILSVANVTVTGSGRHVLKGVGNGKNASSSDYSMHITKMWFESADDTQGV